MNTLESLGLFSYVTAMNPIRKFFSIVKSNRRVLPISHFATFTHSIKRQDKELKYINIT